MPMRVPEPGGTAVKVTGPSVFGSARSAVSLIEPPTSSRNTPVVAFSSQPRGSPPTLPFAIGSTALLS